MLIVDNDSSSPPLNYDDGQCAICLGRSGSSRQEIRHSLWSRFLFEMSHPVVPNQIGMSDLHNYFIEFYCIIIWGLMLQKEDAKKKNKSKGKTKYVCFFFS